MDKKAFWKLEDTNITFFFYLYLILIINPIFGIIYNNEVFQSLFLGEIFPAYLLAHVKQQLTRSRVLSLCYQVFLFIWISCFFFIDFYCVVILNHNFDIGIVNLILGSNLNESLEFFELFFGKLFSIKGLIICLSVLLISLLYIYLKKINIHYYKFINFLLLSGGMLSLFFYVYLEIMYKNGVKENGMTPAPTLNIIAKTSAFFRLEPIPNLNSYLSNPDLRFKDYTLPKNVVLIIGESFSKDHSSLYGYDKETTPKMRSLEEEHRLFVFQNVESPAIQTVPAFKLFMSDYSQRSTDQRQWYECLTIPEVFHVLGYRTIWLSNQNRTGFYDNVCTRYAELCDTNYFMEDFTAVGSSLKQYDENILQYLREDINNNQSGNQMYFIHLMGSHPLYGDRYPETFSRFSPSDYMNKPNHQKENFATYDTSLAYNDSIVCEIIDDFSKKESLIIYFSDHGQDFYQSDPYYAGHAKYTAESSHFGKQIPFVIYLSPDLMKNHPSWVQLIEKNLNTQFSTEDLIYCLMDLMEIKFAHNEDVAKYTLFKNR